MNILSSYEKNNLEIKNKKKEVEAIYNSLGKEKYDVKSYRYILMKGNNDLVIRRVMDTRPSWQKIKTIGTSLFDFKWTPYSSNIKFDFLGKHGEKNLVNHFEHH
jgi:hypothetical protein